MSIREQAQTAKEAALSLAVTSHEVRNKALYEMASALREARPAILEQNAIDIAHAREKKLSSALIERLTLNDRRVEDMARGLEDIASLPDPLGKADAGWITASGIEIMKKRVPLGVIGIIYESRPNVTTDAAGLCVKSGNACILRGGSEALRTNCVAMDALERGACAAGLPGGSVALVRDTSREIVREMMGLHGLIDVLIPRGGAELIKTVVENARIPVIETGTGVCHVYVDRGCDVDMALDIAVSAKISRPSTCNSAETLLVDEEIAAAFLPACCERLREKAVEMRGCERTRALCGEVIPASAEDYSTEHLDLIYNIKIVSGVQEAIGHINRFGTRHSEAIITRDMARARVFCDRVDAAAVYVNASTRFTDGGEYGFGAEIGISNQKLHARGPMGLAELTTYKYIGIGNGQTR